MPIGTDAVYTNSSSWMSMAIESTPGTSPATPVFWIPVQNPKLVAMITEVDDDALRGSMVKVYEQVPTVRHDEYTFTCYYYFDSIPALFRSILGSADVITGSGPYTHSFSVLNSAPLLANQPPTYSFYDYDGYKVRQIGGCQVDEITIKFTATGLLELTVKVLGQPYTLAGSVASSAFTTTEAAPSWSCTPTLNSVVATRLVEGEVSLKRGSKPIHTIGGQGPYKIQPGPLEIAGKLTVLNKDDTELGWYLNNTAVPISLLFAPPANAVDTFLVQMTKVKLSAGAQERGGDELIVSNLDLIPLPNTTDVVTGAGGLSPIKITCTTSLATTY